MPDLPDGQVGGCRGFVDSKAAHNPTAPTPLAHRESASGLSRFACLTFKDFPLKGGKQGVTPARGQQSCPPPGAPTHPVADRPQQGPVRRRAHRGRSPGGLGAARPAAEERPRRGLEAGGSSRPEAATAPTRPPLWGV